MRCEAVEEGGVQSDGGRERRGSREPSCESIREKAK